MYDYIKGKLISKQINSYRGSYIVVESNSIGYFIISGKQTVHSIKDECEIKVYLSLIHREDSMNLCGFLTKEERDIFNILLTVSGVGVKLAFLILDEFKISELINVVIKQDYKELSRTKGVGEKLAQKIIIELKDKLINWSNVNPDEVCTITSSDLPQEMICEVQNVLLSLGYATDESKSAIEYVMNGLRPNKTSEEVLKASLEYLAQL